MSEIKEYNPQKVIKGKFAKKIRVKTEKDLNKIGFFITNPDEKDNYDKN